MMAETIPDNTCAEHESFDSKCVECVKADIKVCEYRIDILGEKGESTTSTEKKEYYSDKLNGYYDIITAHEEFLAEKSDKLLYEKAQKLSLEAINLIKETNKKIKELYSIGLTAADSAADEIQQLEFVSFEDEDDIKTLHEKYDQTFIYISENIHDEFEASLEDSS